LGDDPGIVSFHTEDTVSTVCGNSDGQSWCGNRRVQILSADNLKTVNLNDLPFLSLDLENKQVRIETSDPEWVGEYAFFVQTYLDRYPNLVKYNLYFKINITDGNTESENICTVTDRPKLTEEKDK
jgi:hypothetical protein